MSLNLSESGNNLNSDDSNGSIACNTTTPQEIDDECTKKKVTSKGKGNRRNKTYDAVFSDVDSQIVGVDKMLGIGEHNNDDIQLLLKQQRKLTTVRSWLNHNISQGRGVDCEWYQILEDYFTDYTPREGHLAWLLGSNKERKICINGGFTKDDTVYMLHKMHCFVQKGEFTLSIFLKLFLLTEPEHDMLFCTKNWIAKKGGGSFATNGGGGAE